MRDFDTKALQVAREICDMRNAVYPGGEGQFLACVQVAVVNAMHWAAPGYSDAPLDEVPGKLWLWKNFVDGKPEYWAFDNPFPIHLDSGDPQTLGEPCGYAFFRLSRCGRADVTESEVLRRISQAKDVR